MYTSKKETHLMFVTKRWSPVFLGPQGSNAGAGTSASALLSSPAALPSLAVAAGASGITTCFSAAGMVVAA